LAPFSSGSPRPRASRGERQTPKPSGEYVPKDSENAPGDQGESGAITGFHRKPDSYHALPAKATAPLRAKGFRFGSEAALHKAHPHAELRHLPLFKSLGFRDPDNYNEGRGGAREAIEIEVES